jgi:hypothetical protein
MDGPFIEGDPRPGPPRAVFIGVVVTIAVGLSLLFWWPH